MYFPSFSEEVVGVGAVVGTETVGGAGTEAKAADVLLAATPKPLCNCTNFVR